jgi:lipoprotein-anchoring transpeptidase ErfK/SrfK
MVILSIVCGLWLGYGWLSGPPPQGAEGRGLGEDSGANASDLSLAPVAEASPVRAEATPIVPPAVLQTGAGVPAGSAEAKLGGILQGLEGAERDAAGQAFAILARGEGSPAVRERLAGALRDTAARAGSLLARVHLLGERNAFLHSAEGRALASGAIEAAAQERPQIAVAALTAFLEAAMRGPISKTDAAARGVVDAAYAALQAPLRNTILNPADLTRARTHQVAAGETLSHVAQVARSQGLCLDPGTLAIVNRIDDPRRLRAGQQLKIPVDPIRAVIEKDSFLIAVYVGDSIIRLYWIGHGKADRTPTATFKIGEKLVDPDWFAPSGGVIPAGHPANELGHYFVKFEHESFSGFGAHEARDPATIGERASAGCIRMRLADIEDFFRLMPRGSTVEIRSS